jgi:hypothetical protein
MTTTCWGWRSRDATGRPVGWRRTRRSPVAKALRDGCRSSGLTPLRASSRRPAAPSGSVCASWPVPSRGPAVHGPVAQREPQRDVAGHATNRRHEDVRRRYRVTKRGQGGIGRRLIVLDGAEPRRRTGGDDLAGRPHAVAADDVGEERAGAPLGARHRVAELLGSDVSDDLPVLARGSFVQRSRSTGHRPPLPLGSLHGLLTPGPGPR